MILQGIKAPLFGLVLIGGKSIRMKEKKSELNYVGTPQWENCYNLLSKYCNKVYISTSKNNVFKNKTFALYDIFVDSFGPLTGILTAMKKHANSAWFVLACDMPFFDEQAAEALVYGRNSNMQITAFVSNFDSKPEPTSTIYEPTSFLPLLNAWAYGKTCPREIIENLNVKKIIPSNENWLHNINTLIERDDAKNILDAKNNNQIKKIVLNYHIRYFASMREQSGCVYENIKSEAKTLRELYFELRRKYNFTFDESNIKISVNDLFVDWDFKLKGGEEIIFLPPIAGG